MCWSGEGHTFVSYLKVAGQEFFFYQNVREGPTLSFGKNAKIPRLSPPLPSQEKNVPSLNLIKKVL